MTDIMKLADDHARWSATSFSSDAVSETRAALQSAIEALQGENERVAKELDAAQEEINCAESALEAFSCEFEAEVFNQGFDCLGDFVQALWTASSKERDALVAELAGLKKQGPVGFVAPHDLKTLREGYPATVVMLPSNKRTEPLFATPKALAPNEDTKLLNYLQERQATVEILIDGHGLSTPLFRIGGLHGTICADIRGAIGVAIGIGGTP